MRAFARGQLGRQQCRSCRRAVHVDLPVAVLRSAGSADVLLLFTDDPEPPDDFDEWYGRIEQRVGRPLRLMPLVIDAAPIVLGRELEDDLADPDAATQQVADQYGAPAAQRYGGFLEDVAVGDDVRAALDIFQLLAPVEGAADFEDLLDRNPWLRSDEALEILATSRQVVPGQHTFATAVAQLLRDAREDASTAWHVFASEIERAGGALEAEFAPLLQALERLADERRFDDVITQGEAAIARAQEVGAFAFIGFVDELVGKALLETTSGEHAANVASGLDHLDQPGACAPTASVSRPPNRPADSAGTVSARPNLAIPGTERRGLGVQHDQSWDDRRGPHSPRTREHPQGT
jgi:hypothetical protein